MAELLRLALTEGLDVETDVVANGALVMDSVTARRPDLLILDVELPGLNGLDVFDLLRSDLHWQGVPVLVPHRGSRSARRPPTRRSGVHEILAKPFDIDDLIARAERLIDVKKAGLAA